MRLLQFIILSILLLACNQPSGRYVLMLPENKKYAEGEIASNYRTLQQEIDSDGFGAQIEDSLILNLGNESYEYAEESVFGGNSGNIYVDFILKRFKDSEKFILSYNESQEGLRIKTTIDRSENIVLNSSIDSFLTLKLHESSNYAVADKDPLQKEINRWLDVNDKAVILLKNSLSRKISLTLPKTNSDIFALQGQTSVMATVSNSNYLVKSYFKNCVVAMKKPTHQYFIIWCPYSVYDFADSLAFISADDLVLFKKSMSGKEEKIYSIDLKGSTIMKFKQSDSE